MSKRRRRQQSSWQHEQDQGLFHDEIQPDVKPHRKPPPLSAQTEAQGHYILSIKSKTLTFGVGPAGTGKTYVAAAVAAERLTEKKISKIVVTRPAVGVEDEDFGALPGELEEKFAPWFEPFKDALVDRLGVTAVEYHLKRGNIEVKPLAFMRGKSYRDAFMILDEAQNATPGQLKMFLTRAGEGCSLIVNGDPKQTDLCRRRHPITGLDDAVQRFQKAPFAGIVEFNREDIVRAGFVRDVLDRYEN